MARKASFKFKEVKGIPRIRKTLFFKYGSLIFEPNFDLAIQHLDAVDLAHGDTDVYELMYPGSETAEKTAAFETSSKRIAELEAAHGAETSVQFAGLFKRIRDLNASPKSRQRLDISGACWSSLLGKFEAANVGGSSTSRHG